MAIQTVQTSSFIKDTVLYIRDELITNITDPIEDDRSGNEKFVLTSYPKRDVRYPIITVRLLSVQNPTKLGQQSELLFVTLPVEVRVWARNEAEKDSLSQDVINQLRSTQLGSNGSIEGNLHDYLVTSAVNVDEPIEEGEAGIKSRVINIEYKFILGS